MSSTPKNKNSKPMTPPKTLGWSQALFGSTWLSGKKMSHVDSSTDSTASKSQKAQQRPSPKPFQNLEGFNTVHSPDQGSSKAFATAANGIEASTAASAHLIQQHSASGGGTQTSTAVPSKSPWKASSMGAANGVSFSVGNLKPGSSRAGTTRGNGSKYTAPTSTWVVPADRSKVRHRNKYKTSGVFAVRRNNGRRNTPIDKAQMNVLLLNARSEIEAPSQKIESDRNFRNAFTNRTCRPGARLHPSDKGRLNGRLPNQQQPDNANTRFLSNGKRDIELDDGQTTIEAASTRKKRRVNFGCEENNVTMPIEYLVSTPVKAVESRPSKRKATPYKTIIHTNDDIDDDNNEEDQKIAPASTRKLLKVKRSPSSKKSDPKSGASNVERPEDFPVISGTNVVTDFSSWSTPEERESSTPIKSNMIISDNFMDNYPPTAAAIISNFMPQGRPQFQQHPLFKGEKKDRAVLDDDYDETRSDKKRFKAETWKCEECGGDNEDDETHCQLMVDKDGEKKRCLEGRSCKVKLGWGDRFESLTEGKVKCENCKVWNKKSETDCVSCQAPLPCQKGSTSKNSHNSALTSIAKASELPALGGSIGSQGFSFGGGATTGKKSSTGFSFGNSAVAGTSAAPSSSTSSSTITTGGFKFGASAASSSTATNGGFQFGPTAKVKSPSVTTTSAGGFQFGSPAKPKSPSVTSTAVRASSSPSPNAGVTAAPTPLTGTNSGAQLFGNFAASSTPGSSSTQAPKFSFGTKKDINPISEQVSTTESAQESKSVDGDNKSGVGFPSVTTKDNDGSSSVAMPSLESVATEGSKKKRRSGDDSNTASSSQPKMSFGSKPSTEAPAASLLSGGAPTSASTSVGAPAPFVFGMPSTNSTTEDSSSIDASGFGSSTVPSSFGNTSNTSLTASGTLTAAPAPNFGSTPAPAAPLSFGSTPAAHTPAAPLAFGSTPAAHTPAAHVAFGSTPAAPPSAAPFSFGSTPAPAPAPAAPFSFGSTLAPAPAALAFGSAAPAPAAPVPFGTTPAPGPTSGFGSTPIPSNAMTFGSATPAQSSTTFGSTPAVVPGQFGAPAPMPFGSSAPAPAPISFGTPAALPQPFGNNNATTFNNTATTFGTAQPTAGAAPMTFGGTAPLAQNPAPSGFGGGGFGQQTTQQQAPAPPNAGFSLGSGGGAPRGRTPGRGRRMIRARRPGPR